MIVEPQPTTWKDLVGLGMLMLFLLIMWKGWPGQKNNDED